MSDRIEQRKAKGAKIVEMEQAGYNVFIVFNAEL